MQQMFDSDSVLLAMLVVERELTLDRFKKVIECLQKKDLLEEPSWEDAVEKAVKAMIAFKKRNKLTFNRSALANEVSVFQYAYDIYHSLETSGCV